jgi:hypothetical protein
LHGGFTGFGDLTLFSHFVGARLTQFFGFAVDLHGQQLVGFVAAGFAGRHRGSLPEDFELAAEQGTDGML